VAKRSPHGYNEGSCLSSKQPDFRRAASLYVTAITFEYYALSFPGRNPDFVALNVRFAIDVIKSAFILRMVPAFLKPWAIKKYSPPFFFFGLTGQIGLLTLWSLWSRSTSNTAWDILHLSFMLVDKIEKNKVMKSRWGLQSISAVSLLKVAVAQLDLLTWCIDQARGEETTDHKLTLRILMVNFAAVHTTSMVNNEVHLLQFWQTTKLICRLLCMRSTTWLPSRSTFNLFGRKWRR